MEEKVVDEGRFRRKNWVKRVREWMDVLKGDRMHACTKMREANVASVKDDRKWGKRKDEMESEWGLKKQPNVEDNWDGLHKWRTVRLLVGTAVLKFTLMFLNKNTHTHKPSSLQGQVMVEITNMYVLVSEWQVCVLDMPFS